MKKSIYAFDIETVADESVIHLMPEPEPASNIKDPEKIRADIERKREKQIEKMALSPLTGKICSVAFYNDSESHVLTSNDENELLTFAYQYIETSNIVTFNGKKFDIPFVFKRGIINNHEWASLPHMKSRVDRYKAHGHIDVMEEFCGFGEYESQAQLVKMILKREPMELDFSLFLRMIEDEAGRKLIGKYNLSDAKDTFDLARRCGLLDLWESM